MNRFVFDVGSQLRAKRFVRHQIDRATKQILQVELDTEVPLGRGGTVELYEHINIARFLGVIPRQRPKNRQVRDAEFIRQTRFVFLQPPQCFGSGHHCHRS